jgi:hypothetical protein
LDGTARCGERSGSLTIATASPPLAQPHADVNSILVKELDAGVRGTTMRVARRG